MTARKILDSALKLLGYSEAGGNTELPQRVLNKGTAIINVIYSELCRAEGISDFEPIKNLSEEIKLTERTQAEIMPCGVAMLIAQSESDGTEQQLWAEIYSRKRATLTKIEERGNSIPEVWDE